MLYLPMAFFVALLSSQISVCCRLRTKASDKILQNKKETVKKEVKNNKQRDNETVRGFT